MPRYTLKLGSKLFLLFLMILSLEAAGLINRALIQRAAEKCCTEQKVECCVDMMSFGKPVTCGFEKDTKWAGYVYKCLQDTIFEGRNSSKTNLDDLACCQVFGYDSKDSSKKCEKNCKVVMGAPSLASEVKLERIGQCSLVENPFMECFNKCRQLRSNGIKIEVLQFDEYCDSNLL